MQDGHMYEVGGDCVNIHFAMPTESTGGFGFQCFNDLIERSGQSALQRNYWGNGKSVIWTKVMRKQMDPERDLEKFAMKLWTA